MISVSLYWKRPLELTQGRCIFLKRFSWFTLTTFKNIQNFHPVPCDKTNQTIRTNKFIIGKKNTQKIAEESLPKYQGMKV